MLSHDFYADQASYQREHIEEWASRNYATRSRLHADPAVFRTFLRMNRNA